MPDLDFTLGDVSIAKVLIFLFIFILTVIIGNIIRVVLKTFLETRISRRDAKLISRVSSYLVLLLGLSYGIIILGFNNLGDLAAAFGIIGIAVAFSSQQIIQNFIAGILILVQRPVQMDDWIELGSLGICKIKDMTLSHTILKSPNGKIIYIPNSLLLSSAIVNYTKSGFTEIAIELHVAKDSYFDKIKETVIKTAHEHPKILPNVPSEEKSVIEKIFTLPHIQAIFGTKFDVKLFEPTVYITGLDNDGVVMSARIWVREIDKKDEIVSSFMDVLLDRLKQDNMI